MIFVHIKECWDGNFYLVWTPNLCSFALFLFGSNSFSVLVELDTLLDRERDMSKVLLLSIIEHSLLVEFDLMSLCDLPATSDYYDPDYWNNVSLHCVLLQVVQSDPHMSAGLDLSSGILPIELLVNQEHVCAD